MLTRIQLMCMTDKTKADYYGQPVKSARPDYSIHHGTDKRNRSKLCTMPARQRDGETYAGGRSLRRAQTKLAARSNNYLSGDESAHTAPGSLQIG